MRHSGEPRWELDPASSEDYAERTAELSAAPGERFRRFMIAAVGETGVTPPPPPAASTPRTAWPSSAGPGS